MSSIPKIESARANGARSRGPVTPEGRARSSKNAIKHGLSSRAIVLSNESESDFEKLLESYLEQFNPQSEIEASLVQQLVAARWRMERVWAIETSLLDLEMTEQEDAVDQKYESIDEVARTALAFRALCDNSRALNLLSRYESQCRRAGERALDSLLRLQDHRLKHEEIQKEPNYLPTRVSDEDPQFESEELQNKPNHPITRVPEEDPQPPADFAPSNLIAPDLDDFTASIDLLPRASMNTPSPISVVSVAHHSCCRAGVPRNTGFVSRSRGGAEDERSRGQEPDTPGWPRTMAACGREQAIPRMFSQTPTGVVQLGG